MNRHLLYGLSLFILTSESISYAATSHSREEHRYHPYSSKKRSSFSGYGDEEDQRYSRRGRSSAGLRHQNQEDIDKELITLAEAIVDSHHDQEREDRQTSLEEDLTIIDDQISELARSHPALPVLKKLKAEIKEKAAKQIFYTQPLVAYTMTQEAFERYHQGQRFKPITSSLKGKETELDELLSMLLQQIEENHDTCNSREKCLSADIKSAEKLSTYLDPEDDNRYALTELIRHFRLEARKEIYDPLVLIAYAIKTKEGQQEFKALWDHQHSTSSKQPTHAQQWTQLNKESSTTPLKWRDSSLDDPKKKDKMSFQKSIGKKAEDFGQNLIQGLLGNIEKSILGK